MKDKTIYTLDKYRIIEVQDDIIDLESLKGDCFCPEVNKDISAEDLKSRELTFESEVFEYGVFGYILEVWDSNIGQGWTHVYSCFGFVGRYGDKDHYIVDEMKQQINKKL